MILITGERGILVMRNSNITKHVRTKMSIFKGVDLKGPVTLDKAVDRWFDDKKFDGWIVNLGYNEEILLETQEEAEKLFELIDKVLSDGAV